MNAMTCEVLADRLPDWAAGRVAGPEAAAISAHVQTCADCAAQAAVLRALVASRPAAPAGLSERISLALEQPSHGAPRASTRWRRPAWAISAAAVLVLAVGTALLRQTAAPTAVTVASSALGDVVEEESVVWIADDGAVAGAPVLDDLSDEALATLVEELGA